ncbi:MAG TPA: hypothetical protein VGB55_00070 [Tepidisphaeraceae bacterium]|jgi:hypothetical protein
MSDFPTFANMSLEDFANMDLEGLWSLRLGAANSRDKMIEYFKQLGKFLYADRWAREQTVAVQKLMVGTMNQVGTADPAKYDDVSEAVIPFHMDMRSAIKALEAVRGHASRACVNLLTKAVAIDLGLLAGSSMSDVVAALVASMEAEGLSVAYADTGDGFARYFKTHFGLTLPQSDNPTIPDSYIDDDLV